MIYPGQVWRTEGPYGWERVESVLLPGTPDYDGGLPGVVVRERSATGRWTALTWFIPAADEAAAIRRLSTSGYRRRPVVEVVEGQNRLPIGGEVES